MTKLKVTLAAGATAAVLTAGLAAPVFADDDHRLTALASTTSATPRPREQIQDKFKTALTTLRETMRSTRNKVHATRLQRNFALYALRLNNIATRIQSAIDKKKAAGKDTTSAQIQLDGGKAMLAQAITDGQKAVDMFNNISVDKWNVQKPEIKAAIAQAQLTRKEFVEARADMVKAVSILKSL